MIIFTPALYTQALAFCFFPFKIAHLFFFLLIIMILSIESSDAHQKKTYCILPVLYEYVRFPLSLHLLIKLQHGLTQHRVERIGRNLGKGSQHKIPMVHILMGNL